MTGPAVTLHYSAIGQGEALILLHGLFGMSDNLSLIAKPMAENFTVYSIDLRNHGRSPWAPTMTLPEMAEDIRVFMDRHNITSASIVGHSLGGKVAMQLALSHPERVNQLIVADIAPVEYPPHHNDVLEGLRQVDLSGIKTRRDADKQLSQHVHEVGIRQFLLKSLFHENGVHRWRFNAEVISSRYDDLRRGVNGQAFSKPTLFIKGEHSNYIRADNQSVMKTLFPNFKFKMIQNTGHWLHAEKPAAFNGIVERFLLKP
jgi:esterase